MKNQIKKVVLAYSGGLDTSIILKWLQDEYKCEVLTFTADIGQGEELESAKKKAYVEAHKGTVEGIEKMGMKKFAYPINFKTEGFYVLMNITLPAQEVDAMNKLMTITDGLVRQMFVKKEI